MTRPRIVVTMTVIPTREEAAIDAIRSIQAGEVRPDAIYVNVPKQYARFKEPLDPHFIPYLLNVLGVHVILLDHDRACFNKILPVLAHETDPDTLCVTIDDDLVYVPMFLHGLLEGWKEFGGVVGYSGLVYPERAEKLTGKIKYVVCQDHGKPVDMLENGFGTMFPLQILRDFPAIEPLTPDMNPTLYLSDDYVLARYYDFKGVKKTLIRYKNVGRHHDDWSLLCSGNDKAKTYEIAASQNSLMNYIASGKIIRERWGWA
jgi:hypothetical protein